MTDPIFVALASKRPQRARPQPKLIDRPPPAAPRVVSQAATDETLVPPTAPGIEGTTSSARPVARPLSPAPTSWSSSCDVALLAIIEAPLHLGETAAAGFARKEVELRRVLATLSIAESRALHMRLSNPRPGDQLAASFQRLTADRRARLINFVADARRRAALAR